MRNSIAHGSLAVLALGLALLGCDSVHPTTVAVLPAADALPDFGLVDVNPTSSTAGATVSPRAYLGQVSAWYFGHAT